MAGQFAPTSEFERPVILDMNKHHVIACWHNVQIVLWIDETELQAVQTARKALIDFAGRQPEGVGFLQVICEGCQRLPNESRLAIEQLLRTCKPHIKSAPVVYEGNGFRAATVRAIVSGIAALTSQGVRHKVYPSVHGAADDLAQVLATDVKARYAKKVVTAVAEVRRMHLEQVRRVNQRSGWPAPASVPPPAE